jgi:hypothetical protein
VAIPGFGGLTHKSSRGSMSVPAHAHDRASVPIAKGPTRVHWLWSSSWGDNTDTTLHRRTPRADERRGQPFAITRALGTQQSLASVSSTSARLFQLGCATELQQENATRYCKGGRAPGHSLGSVCITLPNHLRAIS